MPDLFIGLMSGTSVDGIDAALCELEPNRTQSPLATPVSILPPSFKLVAHQVSKFPNELRDEIIALFTPGTNEIERLGAVSAQLGGAYASCVEKLLTHAKVSADEITAIGCHGQTIRHRPNSKNPFSLQIGDACVLASLTGIPVVHQFRQADIAKGGQGAPLVPAFHENVFASETISRGIINIGGISNVSWLSPGEITLGWDIGPGNGLMDAWIKKHLDKDYDESGLWARSGQIHSTLLEALLDHPFLQQAPPKSTGKEIFTLEWLTQTVEQIRGNTDIPVPNIQRTLLEFTAQTIANDIAKQPGNDCEIYICGGGAYNVFLLERIEALCTGYLVATTAQLGIAPEWVEACAFAWLAKRFWYREPGNLPSVTGARKFSLLGQLVYP